MASLTKSQQLVYDYLCSTMAERAVPPSVREICAATGLRSTSTVHSHLKSLEALGYITRDAGLNRSIHIVGASAAKQVPILGKVTAGLPILAVEDIEGYIPYPDKSGKELFALHVDGLSMINAGILDGDRIIIRACDTADNSRIARSPNASAICLPDTVITAFPSPYRLIAATSMPSANSVFPLLGAPATNVTRSRSSKFIMPPNTTSLTLPYLTNPAMEETHAGRLGGRERAGGMGTPRRPVFVYGHFDPLLIGFWVGLQLG